MGEKATPSTDPSAGWLAAGLLLAVVVTYWPLGGQGFLILDDDQYITNNGYVRQGLSADGLRWAFTTFRAANWHPLTWLSHMLDVEWFGLDAGKHHLVGVALHGVNALLLFFVLRFMTRATWASALAAALFALHPLRVESVAWASERKELLSGLFCMTTLLAYARYALRPDALRYGLVFVSLALGLMAKPMLVTLPFTLLLLDCWPLRRWPGCGGEPGRFVCGTRVRLLLEKLPLFVLAAASSTVTVAAQRAGGSVSDVDAVPFALRAANAVASYGAYLWQSLAPTGLAYFYPHPAGATRVPASFWIAAVVSGAAIVTLTFFFLRKRKRPFAIFGWLWFLGTLVPVIGLLQVGAQARADRYTYLPSIGLSVLVAWGLVEIVSRRPAWKQAIRLAVPLALVVLALLSRAQLRTWKDDVTLFRHAVEVTTNNHVAHTHLGSALVAAGDLAGAETEYRKALDIEADHADALNALGTIHGMRGDLAGAGRLFERAVAAAPLHADAHHNLGLVLQSRGDLSGAEARFREAIRLRADFAKAWFGLGQVRESLGDRQAAADGYRRVLEINPADEAARAALGRLKAL